ncbi:hypothetical protein JCM10207_005793 [Rhodosporidiobolus poonsookiae]
MPRPATPLLAQVAASTAPKVARTRPLPARKAALFRQHEHLLAAHPLVVFLRPGEFTAQEWRQLRAQIAAVPPPPPAATAGEPSSSSSSTAPADAPSSGLKLTLLRPGLLPALLRSSSAAASPSASTPASPSLDLSLLSSPSHLKGPLAALTAPTLHPPTLAAVLALLQKFSRTPPADAPPPAPGAEPVERLALLSSLIEARAAGPDRTQAVGKLPPLEVLRAQLVGLISAPGSRIAGVLGQRAGEIGRALEGLKKGLEEQEGGAGKEAQA